MLKSSESAKDPRDAIRQAEPLLEELRVHRYARHQESRWQRDMEHLPHLRLAFYDLTLSYSPPERRSSAAGRKALLVRPLEFIEDQDGELLTGKG